MAKHAASGLKNRRHMHSWVSMTIPWASGQPIMSAGTGCQKRSLVAVLPKSALSKKCRNLVGAVEASAVFLVGGRTCFLGLDVGDTVLPPGLSVFPLAATLFRRELMAEA